MPGCGLVLCRPLSRNRFAHSRGDDGGLSSPPAPITLVAFRSGGAERPFSASSICRESGLWTLTRLVRYDVEACSNGGRLSYTGGSEGSDEDHTASAGKGGMEASRRVWYEGLRVEKLGEVGVKEDEGKTMARC